MEITTVKRHVLLNTKWGRIKLGVEIKFNDGSELYLSEQELVRMRLKGIDKGDNLFFLD